MEVHIQGGRVSINNANVIQANVLASNGVVHVIDTVLIPTPVFSDLIMGTLADVE